MFLLQVSLQLLKTCDLHEKYKFLFFTLGKIHSVQTFEGLYTDEWNFSNITFGF